MLATKLERSHSSPWLLKQSLDIGHALRRRMKSKRTGFSQGDTIPKPLRWVASGLTSPG